MRWSRLFGTDIRVSTRFTNSLSLASCNWHATWRNSANLVGVSFSNDGGGIFLKPFLDRPTSLRKVLVQGRLVIPVSVLKGFERARRGFLQCQIHFVRGLEPVETRTLPRRSVRNETDPVLAALSFTHYRELGPGPKLPSIQVVPVFGPLREALKHCGGRFSMMERRQARFHPLRPTSGLCDGPSQSGVVASE
jgi:hypothetical protein